MKLNRPLFPSSARGGFFAFLHAARRERVRIRHGVTVPRPRRESVSRPSVHARWTLDPHSHLPVCHWEAAIATPQRAAAQVPIGA